MDKPSKRAKKSTSQRYGELSTLGKSSWVSQSGMSALLKAVTADDGIGMPEHFSRNAQYRARKAHVYKTGIHGPLIETREVPLEKGGFETFGFGNPSALFAEQYEISDDFAKL